MPLPRRLIALVVAAAAALAAAGLGAAPAHADRDAGLCRSNESRGAVPTHFVVDACTDGSAVWLRNSWSVPVRLVAEGDFGAPVNVQLDQSVAAVVTRLKYHDSLELMPSDLVRVPVGAKGGMIRLVDTRAGFFYIEAVTLSTFLPVGQTATAGKAFYDALSGVIADLANAALDAQKCRTGKNWIQQTACDVVYQTTVMFVVGKALAVGLFRGSKGLIVGTLQFFDIVGKQARAISGIAHGDPRLRVAPASSPGPTVTKPVPLPPPATSSGPQPPSSSRKQAPTSGTLSVALTENPFRCDGGVRPLGVLSGASPGERVTFTSPQVGGLLPGTASAAGTVPLKWQCQPGDVGTTWQVAARGESSGRSITFTVGSAAPPAQPGLFVMFVENPFRCDNGVRRLGTLSGAAPGERVTFTSPELGPLLTGTASPSGTVPLQWQCQPSDVGTSWHVDARGMSSGRATSFVVRSR